MYGFEIFGPNTIFNKTGYWFRSNNLPYSSRSSALFHDRQLCGQRQVHHHIRREEVVDEDQMLSKRRHPKAQILTIENLNLTFPELRQRKFTHKVTNGSKTGRSEWGLGRGGGHQVEVALWLLRKVARLNPERIVVSSCCHRGTLREAKRGGVSKPGGFPFFSGKVQIVSRTLSGLFLVGALNRPRKRKKTNRGNPRTIPEQIGKIPQKSGKSQKDKKGQKRKDESRSGNPPV